MNKRVAILTSVLKLVNRSGFYHLNMKDIAKESKIAAGTIYLYFKGKEDLINALYKMILTDFNAIVLAAYGNKDTVKNNFFSMMTAALEFYIKQPDRFSFVEQYTYAPFLFKENQDENFILLRPIYKLLRDGKKQRIIKNQSDAFLLSVIHGSLNTIIKLHLAGKIDLNKKGATTDFSKGVWEAISIS